MSEDLIKRSDAIKELADYMYEVALLKADGKMRTTDHYIKRAEDALRHIPTIEPKRERCKYCKDGDFIGQRLMLGNDGKWHKIRFCPNCGAEMR